MRTIIVAKTRMRIGVCVGGFTMEDHRCVRLIPQGMHNNPANTSFQIGQYGDIEFEPSEEIALPHTEDVVFTTCNLVGEMDDLRGYLTEHAQIVEGHPSVLFNGLLRATDNGKGYISHEGGTPDHSVGYWIADQNLTRRVQGTQTLYCYPNAEGVRRLPFVGLEETIQVIEAGTLMRVSLARWWTPDYAPPGCYLQLSGWYE